MLIKSYRKYHDKKEIVCDQNNIAIGTSSSYSITHPRLSTNIPV